MLANDAATLAVEIPITFTGRDIRHIEGTVGFTISLSLKPDAIITGHIDFVQLRGNHIFILHYKPGAKKDKPVAQLTITLWPSFGQRYRSQACRLWPRNWYRWSNGIFELYCVLPNIPLSGTDNPRNT